MKPPGRTRMLRHHRARRAAMRAGRLVPLALLAGMMGATAARADETVSLASTVAVPGNPLAAYDISFVDGRIGLYILADRSNSGVDVFSSAAPQFLFRVGGFAGAQGGNNDIAGPNGVLT